MHEFSMAEELLAVIKANAKANNAKKVTSIKVSLCNISSITPEALSLSFDAVSKGTIAEGAFLTIEAAPLVVRCRGCYLESKINAFNEPYLQIKTNEGEGHLHDHSINEMIHMMDLFKCSGCGCKDFDVLSESGICLESLELDI